MDQGVVTIIVSIVNTIGIIVVAYFVNRVRHATNGMKATLEKAQYDKGVRDEHNRAEEERNG
jgi:FtsZ-interacting cell division protein ZipA